MHEESQKFKFSSQKLKILACQYSKIQIEWIKKNFNSDDVIYMGDGIFDHLVMKEVAYSIAPSNSDSYTKEVADFVTQRSGGDRAVAEACLHILKKFFVEYNQKKNR